MIAQLISFFGSIIVIIIWLIENLGTENIQWYEFIEFSIPVVITIVNGILLTIKYFKLVWIKIFYKSLRVSMAYLFQIEIDGKYLLVSNSNKSYYQFPGGKYKFYEGAKTELNKFNKTKDDLLPSKKNRENDIAFNINPLKFYAFMEWFDSNNDREIEHNREFYEELIKPNNFPINEFINLNFRKIRTVKTSLHRTNINNKKRYEFLCFDLLEPVFSEMQLSYFKQLRDNCDNEYVKWVTDEEIEKLSITVDNNYTKNEQEIRIGEHTLWCIKGKYSKRR